MFDIGFVKLVLLLVLVLIIFGPEQLPTVARKAAQTLRRLRRLAEDATGEIKAGLGPEHAGLNLMVPHPSPGLLAVPAAFTLGDGLSPPLRACARW